MKKILLVVILIISLGGYFNMAKGAEPNGQLFLLPDINSYLQPDTFSVDVLANTDSALINAFQINLEISAPKIEFVNSSDKIGLCDFFYNEEIKNNRLIITCASYRPIIASNTRLMTINFNKLEQGQVKINSTYSGFFAFDGKGTNILKQPEIHNFYIIK